MIIYQRESGLILKDSGLKIFRLASAILARIVSTRPNSAHTQNLRDSLIGKAPGSKPENEGSIPFHVTNVLVALLTRVLPYMSLAVKNSLNPAHKKRGKTDDQES